MSENDAPTTPENNKAPVDSTWSSFSVWVKAILFLLVIAMAAINYAATEPVMPSIWNFLELPDLPSVRLSVRAATFAMCAAVMLSLTMIRTGDGPDDNPIDLLIRLMSLTFAFLSGWSWLESALGELSLYYFLTIGLLSLIAVVGALLRQGTALVCRFARNLPRRIQR